MKAVADRYTPHELAVLGVNAGVDVFLACKRPEVVLELYRGIVRAVEDEAITHESLIAAEKRALAWHRRFFQPGETWSKVKRRVGPAAHGGLVEEIQRRLREGLV
jgi:beta-glucosidase-like glycosyl hydrolase